eukprot:Mrub_10888.p1 GENE.Mrub_10888~~Mrub_10888.p1  ORF type:complete len:187 (-),score=13.84 Mrub_10888:91-576(-)
MKDVSVLPTKATLKHFFGSEKRQDRLRAHFEWIKKQQNLKFIVLTYNNRDCVNHCFNLLGLSSILPNVEVYDWNWMNSRKMFSKGEAIKNFRQMWNVSPVNTLFVDDSDFNIESAKSECNALQCSKSGMTIALFDEIESRCEKRETFRTLQSFLKSSPMKK